MRALAASALLYLVLAAAVLHHELIDAPGTADAPAAADLLAFYAPQMRYAFTEIGAGRLPLWNPHQAAGTPLLAHPAIGFFYPLYAPFLVLNLDTALAVHMVLHLALAAIGMSLFAATAGLGRGAAIVAGIVYAFQGSTRIKLFHPPFLIGAAALPWIFWLVLRTLERPTRRRTAGLAIGAGIVLLGAELQFLYFTALALGPLVAAHLLRRDTPQRWRGLAMLVLAVVLALGVGLVRIIPGAELMRSSWRPPGGLSLEAATIMSIPVRTYLTGLVTPIQPGGAPGWSLHDLQESYLGIAPLLLALIGLALWPRRHLSLPIAAAGIGAAWYAAGATSPLYRLLFLLPGGAWFRGPDRVLIVTGFAVAFLCGAGIAVLRDAAPRSAARAAAVLIASIVVLGAGLSLGAPAGRATLIAYTVAAAVLAASLLVSSLPAWLRTAAVAALAGLIFVDLARARALGARLPGQQAGDDATAQLLAALARQPGEARSYIDARFDPGALSFTRVAKAGTAHGFWQATDYDGQCGWRLATYLDRLGARPFNPMGFTAFALTAQNRPLADLLGIRYYAVDERNRAELEQRFAPLVSSWQRLWHDDDIALYEDADALPRVFVADHVEVAATPADALARLGSIDLRHVAVVEATEPQLPRITSGSGAAAARIADYEPDRVVIDAHSDAGGLLVLTDQYDPWWRATVDGAAAPIYRTDYLFRGVPLPAGAHRIVMRYRPWPLAIGGVGSAVSLLAIAALLRGDRRAADSRPVPASARSAQPA